MLNLYGFGHVWLEQGVGDINIFLHVFKQRLKDCNYQQWHEQLDLQGKLRDYKNYKSLLEPEKFLTGNISLKYRRVLSKFRCADHKFNIETRRRKGIDRAERHCELCLNHDKLFVEDEFHVCLICPAYNDLSSKYLSTKYTDCPTLRNFYSLMGNQDINVQSNLATYLFHLFKLRDTLLAKESGT